MQTPSDHHDALSALPIPALAGAAAAAATAASRFVCGICSGAGVPPKLYPNNWYVPAATPLNYSGPYAMEVVDIKW
jgi:hypothetical protein